MNTSTASIGSVREEVLKVNEYKRVVLVHDTDARSCWVAKSFTGHALEDCRRNALHTFRSLQLMKAEFAPVLRSPEPLDLSLDDCSVRMEYLGDLPAARQLCLADVPALASFFSTCYELGSDIGYLGSIRESVHLTERVKRLIDSGFPMRLGFKGDLYENLRVGDGRLMLADTETASLEPLGLSELVLYVFMASSFRSPSDIGRSLAMNMQPVAFRFLSSVQCEDLIEAAIEFAEANFRHVPAPIRAIKSWIAGRLLYRAVAVGRARDQSQAQ